MQLDIAEIRSILGARPEGGASSARGYSIDSRSIEAGDLFFAIRGPRLDGHSFVRAALEKGAVAAVVEESYGSENRRADPCLIRVPNTTLALQRLAQAVRRQWGGEVIGITGSVGKTTTKEMIAAVLETRYRTLKSPGNLNNQYGVPLTLLRLEPEHQVAVIEMAMSGPGEIAALAGLAEPQIGVVTNVAPAHLEFFDSIDAIATAKRELIEHLAPPRRAVLNHDDSRVRAFGARLTGRAVTFGLTEGADYRATDVRMVRRAQAGVPVMEFEIEGPSYAGRFSTALPGSHNVENALAAIATASLFGVPAADLRAALAAATAPGQRTEVLILPGNVTLINDGYNSNPRAMELAIEMLMAWPDARRRLVIAGEMLELGPASQEWHRRLGRELGRAGVAWLIAVQGDARLFLEGAAEAGLPPERTSFFLDSEDAGRFCRSIAEAGDVILVKGSRGVGLESAIEAFKGAPPATRRVTTAVSDL